MNIGKIMKDIRTYEGDYQKEIAKILNITERTYRAYEEQYRIITTERLNIFCNNYEISFDYILGLTTIKKYEKNVENLDVKKQGERLKELRKDKKITQEMLAKLINTSQSTISPYEGGKNILPVPFLYAICKKYNISADYLLGKIDNPKYLK